MAFAQLLTARLGDADCGFWSLRNRHHLWSGKACRHAEPGQHHVLHEVGLDRLPVHAHGRSHWQDLGRHSSHARDEQQNLEELLHRPHCIEHRHQYRHDVLYSHVMLARSYAMEPHASGTLQHSAEECHELHPRRSVVIRFISPGLRRGLIRTPLGSAAISDLVLAVAPIMILWDVKISLNSKLLLCGLLSIGFL